MAQARRRADANLLDVDGPPWTRFGGATPCLLLCERRRIRAAGWRELSTQHF
jgi:hypothetical protein